MKIIARNGDEEDTAITLRRVDLRYPKQIADDLATLGISVSDDTVRQKLKDAFDTIGLAA